MHICLTNLHSFVGFSVIMSEFFMLFLAFCFFCAPYIQFFTAFCLILTAFTTDYAAFSSLCSKQNAGLSDSV